MWDQDPPFQTLDSASTKIHELPYKQITECHINPIFQIGNKIPRRSSKLHFLFLAESALSNIEIVVRAGLELRISRFQVRYPDHSATLPPLPLLPLLQLKIAHLLGHKYY